MSLTSKQVPVLHSDAEALKVAHELAAVLKRDSALRDRERRLPHDELELFSHTGLWAFPCPRLTVAPGFPAPRWPKSLR